MTSPISGSGAGGGLRVLRLIFFSYVSMTLLFFLVLVFITSGQDSTSGGPLWAGISVASALVGFVALRLVERPLGGTTQAALAMAYRQRFFLRLAFAEVPSLLAFIGAMVTNQLWVYPVGLVCSAVGFVRAAPTDRRLEQDAERLRADGCRVDLITALTASTTSAP